MSIQVKQSIVIILASAFFTACASAPKLISLPISTLDAPTKIVDGSAIAFQANAGSCSDSGFQISPKLEDGNYGPAEKITFSNSMFSFKSKGLTQKNFSSSGKQLYAKSMAPGDYVITRIWCTSSNGYQVTTLYTKPERIDIFGEFTVDPGKTNYIGGLTVGKAFGGNAPSFTIRDQSDVATAFFDEHYADKVAPMQVKLAQRKGPGQSGDFGSFGALLEALQEAKEKLDAEKAAKEADNSSNEIEAAEDE